MEPLSSAALELVARRFRLLGNAARLALLQQICDREHTVSELQELTGLKQSHVSRQLGMLDAAGLVRRRADGNRVYYEVADADLPRLCEIVHGSLRERQGEIQAALLAPPRNRRSPRSATRSTSGGSRMSLRRALPR
jgi:DNA-binding transcriptional ArsR family regulator